MQTPAEVFLMLKQFCFHSITGRVPALQMAHKAKLVAQLRSSPFNSHLLAWSVFDLHEFRTLHEEGYPQFFGWPDASHRPANLLEVIHPDDLEQVGALYRLALETFMRAPDDSTCRGRFCLSYRMYQRSGQPTKVMETISTIECAHCGHIPLLCLRQLSKIDAISCSDSVRHEFQVLHYDANKQQTLAQTLALEAPVEQPLHPNELAIARLVRKGLTSKEIADQICLSKHSVDRYRKNILLKTRCKNSPEAIDYMERMGWI